MADTGGFSSKEKTKEELLTKIKELKTKLTSLSMHRMPEPPFTRPKRLREYESGEYRRYGNTLESTKEPIGKNQKQTKGGGTLPKGFGNTKPEQEPESVKQSGIKVKHLILALLIAIPIVAISIVTLSDMVSPNTQPLIIENQNQQTSLMEFDYSMNAIAEHYPNINDFIAAVNNGVLDYEKLPQAAKIVYDKRGAP